MMGVYIPAVSPYKAVNIQGSRYMDRKSALDALAALGQETRLDVFRLLVRAGFGGVPAGEIATRLGAVQNTTSAHLKVLVHAGLIRPERDGRVVRYVADMTGFRDLLAFLMEDCCNGKPELCRPVIDAVTCHC
jgi:DNA-binding transcriptional ArsR family regulator